MTNTYSKDISHKILDLLAEEKLSLREAQAIIHDIQVTLYVSELKETIMAELTDKILRGKSK